MFKIANNVPNPLQYFMFLCKVELTSNNQNFGNVEIKRGISQGDSLSSLLFITGLIPLSDILRKCKESHELSNSRERIIDLLHMNDLKLYEEKDKGLDLLILLEYYVLIYAWSLELKSAI